MEKMLEERTVPHVGHVTFRTVQIGIGLQYVMQLCYGCGGCRCQRGRRVLPRVARCWMLNPAIAHTDMQASVTAAWPCVVRVPLGARHFM